MSKTILFLGLVVSSILHFWLIFVCAESGDGEERMVETIPVPEIVEIAEQHVTEPASEVERAELVESIEEEVEVEAEPVEREVPELEESGKQVASEMEEKGDLAGRYGEVLEPVLRIDWGDESEALEILRAGGMKLVILEGNGSVSKEVMVSGGVTEVGDLELEAGRRYSDNLRVVDRVPAFEGLRRKLGLRVERRLVVMVPVDVERMMEAAKVGEASKRGLSLDAVEIFGGRFERNGSGVVFVVDKVRLRRG